MVQIYPLQPYRPTVTLAEAITTQAFEKPREALYPAIPPTPDYSFQHVLQPERFTVQRLSEAERLHRASAEMAAFLEQQLLVPEKGPAVYVYQQQAGSQTYTGIVAGLDWQEYTNGTLRQHEHIHQERVQRLLTFFREVGVSGTPTLLAHADNRELEAWKAEVMAGRKLYNFTTKDGTHHEVWRVTAPDALAQLRHSFSQLRRLYIADGHHRSYTLSVYAQERLGQGVSAPPLMSCIIPTSQLSITSFHRLVQQIPGGDSAAFLQQAAELFLIEKLAQPELPGREGELTVAIGTQWYKWTVRAHAYESQTLRAKLDVYILDQAILKIRMGLNVDEGDPNLRFVEGTMPLPELQQKARNEGCEVLFLLHPIGIQTLISLANAGETLPPKSTWIEPKLRSGLFVQPLNRE